MNVNAPWKIIYNTDYMYEPDEEDRKHQYISSIEDAKGQTVLYTDSGHFKPKPEYARLIAAAPDLLEVLKHIILDIDHPNDFADAVQRLDIIRMRCAEAIAKAEGQDQGKTPSSISSRFVL